MRRQDFRRNPGPYIESNKLDLSISTILLYLHYYISQGHILLNAFFFTAKATLSFFMTCEICFVIDKTIPNSMYSTSNIIFLIITVVLI